MYFDPKTDKFPYPENTDEHYLKIKKNNGLDFNSDYPYFDKSKDFRFKQSLIRFLLVLIVFPISRIYIGLKIKGKKNVKKNKELLKNGAISVCNHVRCSVRVRGSSHRTCAHWNSFEYYGDGRCGNDNRYRGEQRYRAG